MLNALVRSIQQGLGRLLACADAAMNRLYGWRGNPLYQSGTIVVLAFIVMLVTGLYLLFFYRVGDPYASMLRIESQVFAGRWIRALHRYASDLTVAATAVHSLRMFVQGKSWGPRLLAWVSGLILLFLMYVCGWTGYVMVWDEHAILLAKEGARLLDAMPIFSEPLVRAFVGERPIPGAFFFLNLFAHVALPIGVALLLWVHVAKIARPVLLPPRRLMISILGLLLVASVFMPSPLGPKADPFHLPETVALDWFFGFWLPLSRGLDAEVAWAGIVALSALALLAPIWSRPRAEDRPPVSAPAHDLCTGCFQCTYDCPYGAIDMIDIETRDHLVANVSPTRCVSCGICSGSCAPMAVGPPAWTGRDEVAEVRAFVREHAPGQDDVVVIACEHGAGRVHGEQRFEGAPVYPARCAGNLHTSVIELLLRGGAGGVLIVTCPPRDCRGREGPKWLNERVYHEREAELRESLDRRRLRIVGAGSAERAVMRRELDAFRTSLRQLALVVAPAGGGEVELDAECDGPPAEEAAS
jgi:ferredoxin